MRVRGGPIDRHGDAFPIDGQRGRWKNLDSYAARAPRETAVAVLAPRTRGSELPGPSEDGTADARATCPSGQRDVAADARQTMRTGTPSRTCWNSHSASGMRRRMQPWEAE